MVSVWRMEERNLMRKRISLLFVALMLALTMAFGGAGAAFAAPNCAQVPNNPNCVTVNPGGQQQGCQNNPNCEQQFRPGNR